MSTQNDALTWSDLRAALGEAGRDLPPQPLHDASFGWPIRIAVGFGVWVGASLLAFGVGLMFLDALNGPAALLFGLPLLAGAAAVSRIKPHPATEQLVFVLSFSGQLLIVLFCLWALDLDEAWAVVFALMQIPSVALIRGPTHRTVGVMGGAVALLSLRGAGWPAWIVDGVYLLAGAGMVGIFATGLAYARRGSRALWRPVGYGAAAVVNGTVLAVVAGLDAGIFTRREFGFAAPTLMAVLTTLAMGGLLVFAARRHNAGWRPIAVGLFTVVLVALLTRGNVLLLCGLLTVGLGHQARRRGLHVLGLVSLGVGLWSTYYSLDVSLMTKSLIVVGTGLGLLVALAVVSLLLGDDDDAMAQGLRRQLKRARLGKEALATVAAALLVVVTVVGLSAQKQAIVDDGRLVLLPIAPRDPRSLMQGDYMRLDTRVARDARQAWRDEEQVDGVLAVTLDEHDVATFSRLDPTTLEPGEVKLRYRVRMRRFKVGSTEFFFEEGRGPHFAQAKFAAFRVDEDGTSVLTGLRDATREPL